MVAPDDLVPLGESGWQVWRSAVLRGPGFPADGLDLLSTPECAESADALLAGASSRSGFDAVFAAEAARNAARLGEIAADPLFREAVTWQSLSSLEALDGLARTGPDAARNSRQRQREIVVTRYWQRYCAKNDTIGFFGPVCWARFEPVADALRVTAGPGLTRQRVTDLEWRALNGFAEKLAADPRFRPWLPVTRQPHLALDGDRLLRVGEPPLPLTPAARALLAASDGTRSAMEAVAVALQDNRSGLRNEADALLALEQLAEQGLLRWGWQLPITIAAETRLRDEAEALGDKELRNEATSLLVRLSDARDRLADAAGNPDAVREAMVGLQQEFVSVTGGPVEHRPGATYAGRGLSYEESVRDLDVEFGEPVLSMLAPTLVPLLHAARWMTAAIAESFSAAMLDLHQEAGGGSIPLGDLWHEALGIVYGTGPVRDVQAEFIRRWSSVIGLEHLGPEVREVTLDSAEVAKRVAEAFPADAPGWSAGRIHSPDLHLCAQSAEDFARGDFTAVLGELHVAWLTCNGGYLTRFHPEPGALRAALQRDLGDRVVVLHPSDYPQFAARIAFTLDGPDDVHLAYTAAPVPDPAQVLPVAAVTVSVVDGELVCSAPDGRSWPLLELFSSFLSYVSGDMFKVAAAGGHTPRVSIDRLVVHRETWRTTVGECGLDGKRVAEADQYLAVRRWRARLGLPERVFIRVGTEIKPCYVDFTSPAFVAAFVAMARSAQRAGGPGVALSVSEMLPNTKQAWVPDGAGRRYFSELRMAVRDPVPARTADRKGRVDG